MRNAMFDVLKGLGIISVVLSHVYRGGTDPLAIFVREVAMWALPMFFIIQGYFLFRPQAELSGKQWVNSSWKKIKTSYIPYLYWAIAYGLFFYFTAGKTFTVEDLILGKTALHLYYMFYYIIFAVFFPLLFFIPKVWRHSILVGMMAVNVFWILMLEVAKTYGVLWIHWSGPCPFKWWGFVALGILIAEYPKIEAYIRTHAKAFLYGGIALTVIGIAQPYLNGTTGYLFSKVALIPMSLGIILVLAIYYSSDKAIGKSVLSYIGSRTFGIYLAHFFFVDFFRNVLIPGDRTLVALLIIGICLAGKYLRDKVMAKSDDIPILRFAKKIGV